MDQGCDLHNQASLGLYLQEDRFEYETLVRRKTSTSLARIMLDTMRSLWERRELCDYTIQTNETEFQVHKVVLASVSEYFRVMLTGGLKESRQDFIQLKGVSAEGLAPIINMIYTDKELQLSQDNLVEVLGAASHLQVPLVIHLCKIYMENNIDVSNCIDILNLVFLYSLHSDESKLLSKAADCIQDNWASLKQDGHLRRLSFDSFHYLASHTDLNVSEVELFKAIAEWSETDSQEVERVSELVDWINFSVIPPKDLDYIWETIPFVQSNIWCCHQVEEAQKYHMEPVHTQIINTSMPTKVRGKPLVASFSGHVLDPETDLPSHLLSHNHFAYVSKSEQWVELEDSPVSFGRSAWTVYNNFLIVCGGSGSGSSTGDECYVFDPRFSKWTQLAPMNFVRQSFSVVVCSGYLYAIGGTCNDTIEQYCFENNEWTLCTHLDGMVWDHSACVLGDLIYISGGRESFDEESNRFRSFNPQTKSWQEKASMPSGSVGHTMITRADMTHEDSSPDSYIYVFNGFADNSENFGTVGRYNPDANAWSLFSLPQVPGKSRIVECLDELYFINGSGNASSLVGLTPEEDVDDDDMAAGVCVRLCGTIETERYQILHRLDRYPERYVIDPVCCALTFPADILTKNTVLL